MEITSNVSSSHGKLVADLLSDSSSDLFFVSPFLTGDFEALFNEVDFSKINSIVLVTTLKKNDQDQITKPKSLKSFYKLIKSNCPNAKVKVHIDNSLHGKIYIFRENDSQKAIVTSANLTQNGFYNNNEWGLLIDDKEAIEQLENEVLECIDYPDVTESIVDRLLMFSEQYQRDNPEWAKVVTPDSDIMENVYNQGANNNDNPRYWLKPIGVSEDPIYKEDRRDFSDLHQDLAFSKKGVGAIRAGDIIITTAVGCGCLLSYFQITGSPKEATHEEKQQNPWKERWPWHIEGRSLSTEYGACWWEYDLDRKVLLERFLEQNPDEIVTQAGARSLGTLNFGSDKVEITKGFAEFLISEIRKFD
ncbi:phospholipase D-like domain-containing protein [uncultured Pseudoteredinibacter sp.]|uniref:phospholipase D-like domain-containing protein n=1 Tax=uncultured Pseudoteredinibacter sp. TaxID=1641701 RepID=UPI002635B411|nr:phospholipase D-like domain-containing protein [uncultured Pseudoteredinibacter sp.]